MSEQTNSICPANSSPISAKKCSKLATVRSRPIHSRRVHGSVRTHASKRLCCRTSDDVRLRRLQSGQHGCGSAEEERSAAAGGNVLVGAGALDPTLVDRQPC